MCRKGRAKLTDKDVELSWITYGRKVFPDVANDDFTIVRKEVETPWQWGKAGVPTENSVFTIRAAECPRTWEVFERRFTLRTDLAR